MSTNSTYEKDKQQPAVAEQKRMSDLLTPWKLWLYFLKNLPSAIWWGFRVKSLSPQVCEVTLPFSWRTQNPFRSIYFAALAGAGELSTGLLCNLALVEKGNISMLVLEQKAEFVKKANTLITFRCEQGLEVRHIIEEAIRSNEPKTITMQSTGRNTSQETVCIIYITWTFKVKN